MGKIKRAIVSVTNDLSTDNRVNKLCLLLHENGYRVQLIGRKLSESTTLNRPYQTKRMRLIFNKGGLFYAEYNLRLFFYLLFKRSHLLVSNDLDTLLANYAAYRFKPNSKLFYDSHEYFTEVPELINRKRVRSIWKGIEAWILPKLINVYTVNESIAEAYKNEYKVGFSVVRNIPPLWSKEKVPTKQELGIPENKFIVIIQGAGININRGAEEAVLAMKQLKETCLLVIGSGDVVPTLKQMVKEEGLSQHVLFFNKMPYEKMMYYTSHADIGLALDKPICLNYKFALPNKVFDYMHASTPILCTKLDEIEKLVLKYKIGHVIEEFNVDNLVKALNVLISDSEQLNEMSKNCVEAAKIENWESESLELKKIYGL